MQATVEPWCAVVYWLGVFAQLWGLPFAPGFMRFGQNCALPVDQAPELAVVSAQTVWMRQKSGRTEPVCAVKLTLPDASPEQRGLCGAQLLDETGVFGPQDHVLRVLQPGEGFVHVAGACPPVVQLADARRVRVAGRMEACGR